jgi:acyl-CoA synthetase (AMP-forming)/AMP-acid ligase II
VKEWSSGAAVADLLDRIAGFSDRLAVATETQTLTYAGLADRVDGVVTALGRERKLVMVQTRNTLESLQSYLGALAGGHVVLPVPAGRDHTALVSTYRPDVIVDAHGRIDHRTARPSHRLHPDLTLLASTSGSTGSPKVVRLSAGNLRSNAASIARYLGIVETDRAATTLPLSYCYGASVIHSHLSVGAALILTDRSVIDAEFWALVRRHGATSFAGVPYTFDLLERAGFAAMNLPDLRYVTQAGGRLKPETVRRFAALGRRRGFDFIVMYGATEATARMAYLPPERALAQPEAIGRAIPGGSFELVPLEGCDEPDVGELVYRGPNVMMGYAESATDLATGRTVEALHTGDLARHLGDGIYQVVGRLSRFAKLYGLRIDLQRVESAIAAPGAPAMCTESEGRLVVAGVGGRGGTDTEDLRRRAALAAGLPADAVHAVHLHKLPVLPSGKPDYPRLAALARDADHRSAPGVGELFADVLQIDPAAVTPESSFVDLGGTSLSYVTTSVRLERILGTLPPHWPSRTVAELQAARRSPDRRRRSVIDTGVALRAVAIVLIVGSHAGLFQLWGGAHILLAVAGFNFAQFCLGRTPRRERLGRAVRTVGWIAIPTLIWIAVVMRFSDDYGPSNLVLLQKIIGPSDSMTAGRMWFIEVLVWTVVVLAAVFAIPAVDRLERRRPFGVAMVFLTLGLALRYDLPGLDLGREAWFSLLAFWFFAAGWAAARADGLWQRVGLSLVALIAIGGYFGSGGREALVGAGLLLLIWLPALRCPTPVAAAAGVIAEGSLYTYLTHFQVYPLFGHPLPGVLASLLLGSGLAWGITALRRRTGIAAPSPPPRTTAPRRRQHSHRAA